MTVLDERPVVSAPLPPATGSHPTPCPAWCLHRSKPMAHTCGLGMTSHFSTQTLLLAPQDGPDGKPAPMMRAELYRGDVDGEIAEPKLYVLGETDLEMSAFEADVYIARLEAFTTQLRFLRAQMG